MYRGEYSSSDADTSLDRRPLLSSAEQKLVRNRQLLGHFYLNFHIPYYQQATRRVDSYGEVGSTAILVQQEGECNDPESYTIKQYWFDNFILHHANPEHNIHTWQVAGMELRKQGYAHERSLFLQSSTDADLSATLTLRSRGNEWYDPTSPAESGLIGCARNLAFRAMYHFQQEDKLTADEFIEKLHADAC